MSQHHHHPPPKKKICVQPTEIILVRIAQLYQIYCILPSLNSSTEVSKSLYTDESLKVMRTLLDSKDCLP